MIEHDETFRWVDVDAMGVVNNSVYLTLFEQARFAYCQRLDMLRGASFPFVLGSTSVRFERPGRADMQVRITATVTRLGNKSFDMDYVVRHSGDVLARGQATLVWVDENLRSLEIPDSVRDRIASAEGIPRRA